jgi:hypothetical protein
MYRRTNLTFTARPSDPDNDRLEVDWTHNRGGCPALPPDDIKGRDTTTYVVPSDDTDGPFCVWAIVRDRYDATVRRSYAAQPTNRDPSAKIVVTGTKEPYPPFSLYRPFQMEAIMVGDDLEGDALKFVWTLRSDHGNPIGDADLPACPGRGPEARCWTPQVGGLYTASVTVTDDHGGQQDLETEPFRVAEDAFPCLRITEPGLEMTRLFREADDQEPVQISVLSVDDDGDPFPNVNSSFGITFTWFESTDTGPMMRKDRENQASYVVSQTDVNNLGKTRRVRVEIADRNVMRSAKLLASCGEDDVCVSSPGCLQRMTWTVTYNL